MLKIAFWSAEDGCGTTSGMAAIASVCADVWNRKTMLFQISDQEGDLHQKLGADMRECRVKEQSPYFTREGWEELAWLANHKKLTETMLLGYLVPVVKGRMYYLPQSGFRKRQEYTGAEKEGICRVLHCAEQISDVIFIDCGSGEDRLSEYLLSQADAVVVTISQERQNLDAYFQSRHVFQGNVIYLINQYHQESIYNKKNLNRLYRLCEEELAVIPHDPVFRHVSEKGRIERFVRRHMHCRTFDSQFYFMQELMQATEMILKERGRKYT